MKASLATGIAATERHRVTAALAPDHLSLVVLSTPSMINLIELTSHRLVEPHLDEAETTVGVHVNVSHEAAALENEEVVVTSTLTRVRRNRLTFEAAVKVGERLIGKGTHERAIIETDRPS